MKSLPHNDAFKPVLLVLENQAEVDAIFAVLNNCRVRETVELPIDSYKALLELTDKTNSHRLHLKLVDLTTKPGDAPRKSYPDVADAPVWKYYVNNGNQKPYRISTAWAGGLRALIFRGGVWDSSAFSVAEVVRDSFNRFSEISPATAQALGADLSK